MAVERTLILAKPDAVERSLAGEIVARFERRGLRLRAARLLVASRELGEAHYAEHREKPFFGELVDFITSGPTLAFVLEGEGAIATARKTIGATNPADADPGSLRGVVRARDAEQPRPRLRLARVGRARDRALVPRWARLTDPPRIASSGRPPHAVGDDLIVLASTSPQRSAILTQLRIPFEVVPPAYEETPGGDPLEHAAGKARSVDGGDAAGARRRHDRPLRRAA